MLEDILKDTYAYKEIMRRGYEEGYKEGFKKGCKKGLMEGVLIYVQVKFEDAQLSDLARTHIAQLDDTEALKQLFAQVITLSNAGEVRRALEEQV